MAKNSKGEDSAVLEKERKEFAAYRAELQAIQPVNSNEAAAKYRAIFVKYFPKAKAIFREFELIHVKENKLKVCC